MEYPKINSLWKRQGWYPEGDKKSSKEFREGRQSFIIGDYSEIEFGSIKKWHVEEKVDGTNIRIIYRDGLVTYGGRTANAQIPCHLLEYLQKAFTDLTLAKPFPCLLEHPYPNVILFGEGYGPKIQAVGGNYAKEPGFILFDVWVNGWWLKRDDVHEIADSLHIPYCPDLGIMEEKEIIDFVKSKPHSKCSLYPQMMEGVICRSEPLMLFRSGKPLMWKLKCREFA